MYVAQVVLSFEGKNLSVDVVSPPAAVSASDVDTAADVDIAAAGDTAAAGETAPLV